MLTGLYAQSQQVAGSINDKFTSVYHAGGNNVHFINVKFFGSSMNIKSVNTTTGVNHDFSFNGIKVKKGLSFPLVSENNVYQISTSTDLKNYYLYSDVSFHVWTPGTGDSIYRFPQSLLGEVVRYALADDDNIYLMTDRGECGFSEAEIYASPHRLLRFSRKDGIFKEISYGLPMNIPDNTYSFWFPLRIGNGFTEWYRTKVVNKEFVYEITRLDSAGNDLWTKEITSKISIKIPEFAPDVDYSNGEIYYDYENSIGEYDTVTNTKKYSLQAVAPLRYIPGAGKYLTWSRVSVFGKSSFTGFYFMVLDHELSVLHTDEKEGLVKNPELTEKLPKFARTKTYVGINEKGEVFINNHYQTINEKTVAIKSWLHNGNLFTESEFELSLENLTHDYYCGFETDAKNRSLIKGIKKDALKTLDVITTKSGVFYFSRAQKEDNLILFPKN